MRSIHLLSEKFWALKKISCKLFVYTLWPSMIKIKVIESWLNKKSILIKSSLGYLFKHWWFKSLWTSEELQIVPEEGLQFTHVHCKSLEFPLYINTLTADFGKGMQSTSYLVLSHTSIKKLTSRLLASFLKITGAVNVLRKKVLSSIFF